MPDNPLRAVLVGAGQRGHFVYGAYATRHPNDISFVGVADPNETRRNRFAETHGIDSHAYADWADLVHLDADLWVVASPDRHHRGPAMAALDAGAHVVLEKPMAATAAEVVDVVNASLRSDRQVHVAHVLRYTPFFMAVKEVIDSGRLGDIVTTEHRENVVHWHMAHSFVRGNWANSADSTPMIVQKCCHDFDILEWNLSSPVTRLNAHGSLAHFRPEHAPEGAPNRCTDGCPAEETCPYEARHIYMDATKTGWPVHVISDDLTPRGRMKALVHGPYGRCAYSAGSDVVDHHVVTMERADGSSTVLVMHGHAARETRSMRYDGTRGTMRAVLGPTTEIEVTDHRSGRVEHIPIPPATGTHGGGDDGLMNAAIAAIRNGSGGRTSAAEALESHLLAFAAEEARVSGKGIYLDDYRASLGLASESK